LSTTTKRKHTEKEGVTTLEPISPGEILLEEYLKPLGISQNRLSRDLDIPVSRVSEIIRGTRAITADTALRLGEYFGTTPEFWLNLQIHFDLRRLRSNWPEIKGRIRPYKVA
jgi:addiction module HigA family antidote